ncbi:MAG: AAA family ATPase [Patescibacteria group bacterium]|nr:AAA family ATPase [Patescibacteria group bacterium]
MPDADLETFALRFRALPGDVPPRVRVRRFLKCALRAYGLVNIGWVEANNPRGTIMNSDFPEEMPAGQPPGAPKTGPRLARVVTRSITLPDRIVLFSPAGWGKTSWAANLPEPIFLTTKGEDGLQKLISTGQLPETPHFEDPAETWNDVKIAVNELIVQDHPYKTFVLDTGNGAERLGQEEVCASEFSGDWGDNGFNAFGRGEKVTASKLWLPFLHLLDALRERRRMRIVLCCHSTVRGFRNAEGSDYDRYEPALTRQGWGLTEKWADMVLYGDYETQTKKDGGKLSKAKATGGKVRLLHTERTATHDAKNRHGLPATIRLGDNPHRMFDAFRAAFPKKPAPAAKPAPAEAAPAPAANGTPS